MNAPAGATDPTVVLGRRLRSLVAAVPIVVLVLCSVSSDMVAMFGRDPIGIWRLLPAGPVSGDVLSAEVSSTAFLLIATALARRKRVGFWMALAAMTTALVVQGATLGHPIAAGLAILVATILVATRDRYRVGTGRRAARLAIGLVVAGVVLAGAAALSASGGASAFGTAAEAVGGLLDLATPVAIPGLATLGLVLVLANVGYLVAAFVALTPVPDTRPAEVVAAARRTLRRVGSGSLYPYQSAPECTPFADEGGTAALATASIGRCSVALGDPAGTPAAAAGLFAEWSARCRADDRQPIVYQASEPLARTLRTEGWRAVPVGREAIVDPRAFDIGSPRVANLRHTVTRSRKGGIRTLWSSSGVLGLSDARLVAGLVRLDAEWRRTAGPQLGFTVGRFNPRETDDTAIAVAVDEHGEPIGICRPAPHGRGRRVDAGRHAARPWRGPGCGRGLPGDGHRGARRGGRADAVARARPAVRVDPASDAVAERLPGARWRAWYGRSTTTRAWRSSRTSSPRAGSRATSWSRALARPADGGASRCCACTWGGPGAGDRSVASGLVPAR